MCLVLAKKKGLSWYALFCLLPPFFFSHRALMNPSLCRLINHALMLAQLLSVRRNLRLPKKAKNSLLSIARSL